MATGGPQSIGSAAWIAAEKENVARLLEQEMEDVEFPVRHEMDWLNEHMAEIFSTNHFNLTEIFKTPGKLRGRTPYTARKRNPDEIRVPLSANFASANQNLRSPSKFAKSPEKSGPSRIVAPETAGPSLAIQRDFPIQSATAESVDGKNEKQLTYPDLSTADLKGKQVVRDLLPPKALNSFSTYNTDSGYHGQGDVDGDDELVLPSTQPLSETPPVHKKNSQNAPTVPPLDSGILRKSLSVDRRTTEGSFVSAQENFVSRGNTVEPAGIEETRSDVADDDTPRPLVRSAHIPAASPGILEKNPAEPSTKDETLDQDGDDVMIDDNDNFDDIGSPSDGSTPAHPLRKNSSFGFASLPPRDPIVTNKSTGSRISRTSHVDIIKPTALGRQSHYTGHVEGPKPSVTNILNDKDEAPHDTSTLHNKLNTQRLHDRISMLGKTQAPRTAKSIAPLPNISASQPTYPELPVPQNNSTDTERAPKFTASTPDEWIKPLASSQKPAASKNLDADVVQSMNGVQQTERIAEVARNDPTRRMPEMTTSMPKSTIQSPVRDKSGAATPPSVSDQMKSSRVPAASTNNEPTTPVSSPRRVDGTPKSRFQSIMRSAKSLFSSSAGLSAAAKLEALSSPSPTRSQHGPTQLTSSPQRAQPSPERLIVGNVKSNEEPKGKVITGRSRLDDPFEVEAKSRPAVLAKDPSNKSDVAPQAAFKEREVTAPSVVRADAIASHPAQHRTRKDAPAVSAESEPKFPLPPASSHGQSRPRPVKPTREVTQKPKPQPVSIRVGSTINRMPISSTASFNQAPNTTTAPGPATKKASNSSLHTAPSNSSFKSSVSSQSQQRAQTAAAAMEAKKLEERDAAARKEDQKKRAALLKQHQEEEARRQERERSVNEENKKPSQRQAEQRGGTGITRLRQGSQPPKPAAELVSSDQQEKAVHRIETGAARPPSRLGSSMHTLGRSINQPPTNPAKPAKRPLDDEMSHRNQVTTTQGKPQLAEPKRRKTEDESNQQLYNQATSLKQQPIRKENGKLSLLAHAYPQAPPPAAHHHTGLSMYKTGPVPLGAAGQQLKHTAPMDMAQYTSGKIPFASNHAMPVGTSHKTPSHKTPKSGPGAHRVPVKSSPQYPPSESIHLPEPPTDSEEEDSDADMIPAPDWAQPSELNAALSAQETWEPDAIFGPQPTFELEEVFKGDRKIKKFRERTSSANWGGPDGLTQDEVTRDLAARRVMRANGGWSFNLS